MATQQLNPNIKEVTLSQVKEDLDNGLTKWKKDDIGFGSLEKKYSLTMQEMIELLANSKVKQMETRIPTFRIIDDLLNDEAIDISTYKGIPQATLATLAVETQIEVAPAILKVQVVQEQPKRKLEAFI